MTQPDLVQLDPMPRLIEALPSVGLFSVGSVTLARAPGRLDVMGGVADYSGSLVCQMPLRVAAGAAVQRRSDQRVVCRSAQTTRAVNVPLDALAGQPAASIRLAMTGKDAWARYLIGCVWFLVQRNAARASVPGVSIYVDSDVPLGAGVSSSAAVEVAVMTALCGELGVRLKPLELAVACQTVENQVVGAPCGVMDQVASCMGEEGSMLRILCQPGADELPVQVLGQVRVPRGFAFVGVHSGVTHEVSGDPYTDTRVAAFMAQRILSLTSAPDPTGGHLANVPEQRFLDEWAALLPERMMGKTFLSRYQHTHDPVTTVNPDRMYNIRDAALHHVLEPRRVERFVGLLGQALGQHGGDLIDSMTQAGELMYASHTSYGKRARLGHPMTDRIVKMVLRQGVGKGFFGAKITGGGCGGTVAILIRDDAATRGRISDLRQEYERKNGRNTMLFDESGPGAAATGTLTRRLEVQS